MKVIYNGFIPFKGFSAMNLFGVVFCRKEYRPVSESTLSHEQVHTMQMRELGFLFFYLLYVLEWALKLPIYGKGAYRRISFEREAYAFQHDPDARKRFGWVRFI